MKKHTRLPALICLLLASYLQAASLSGTVKDPSGAVVSGAAVSDAGQADKSHGF